MSIFDKIYESAMVLREAKNFTSADEIISAIRDNTILKFLNGKKNLPSWLKSDVDNNKNIDELKDLFDRVLKEISRNINNDVNGTIALLIRKSSSLAVLKSIVNTSIDTLVAYSMNIKSSWMKTLDIVKKVELEPYNHADWDTMEKEVVEYKSKRDAKKHNSLSTEASNTLYKELYKDAEWGLYIPLSQEGDSELASHIAPFEYNGKTYYKTRWCTAASMQMWEHYKKNGNGYYVIKRFINGVYTDAWQIAFKEIRRVEIMDKKDERKYSDFLNEAPDALLEKIVCDNSLKNGLTLKDFKYSSILDSEIDVFFSIGKDEKDLLINYLKDTNKVGALSMKDFKKVLYDKYIKENTIDSNITEKAFDSYGSQACIQYTNLIRQHPILKKEVDLSYTLHEEWIKRMIEYASFMEDHGFTTPVISSDEYYKNSRDIIVGYLNYIKEYPKNPLTLTYYKTLPEDKIQWYMKYTHSLGNEDSLITEWDLLYKPLSDIEYYVDFLRKNNISSNKYIGISELRHEEQIGQLDNVQQFFNIIHTYNVLPSDGFIYHDWNSNKTLPYEEFFTLQNKYPIIRNGGVPVTYLRGGPHAWDDIKSYVSIMTKTNASADDLSFKSFLDYGTIPDEEFIYYLSLVHGIPQLKPIMPIKTFWELGGKTGIERLKNITKKANVNITNINLEEYNSWASYNEDNFEDFEYEYIEYLKFIKANPVVNKMCFYDYNSHDEGQRNNYMLILKATNTDQDDFTFESYDSLNKNLRDFILKFALAKKSGKYKEIILKDAIDYWKQSGEQLDDTFEYLDALDNDEILPSAAWINGVRQFKNLDKALSKQLVSDIKSGLIKIDPKEFASMYYTYEKYGRDTVLEFLDLAAKGAFDNTATIAQFAEYGAQNLNDINILKHRHQLWPTFSIEDCFRVGPDRALQISKELMDKKYPEWVTLDDYFIYNDYIQDYDKYKHAYPDANFTKDIETFANIRDNDRFNDYIQYIRDNDDISFEAWLDEDY